MYTVEIKGLKSEADIKWVNSCYMCCMHCISCGTGECSECCQLNSIDCQNCALECIMFDK